MTQKASSGAWKAVAFFFLAWFVTAGWLIWGGETSPVVRFAFALSGSVAIFGAHSGGFVGILTNSFRWLERKRVGCWLAVLFSVLLVTAILFPGYAGYQRKVRAMAVAGDLKREGLRLLDYAEDHGGFLPPQMGRGDVYRYIVPMEGRKNPYSGRFKWCGELGGIYLGDVSRPDEVVMAYAAKVEGVWRPVLYLDGHAKSVHTHKQWNEALRARPALLALALKRKAEREAKVIKEESRVLHGNAKSATKGDQK